MTHKGTVPARRYRGPYKRRERSVHIDQRPEYHILDPKIRRALHSILAPIPASKLQYIDMYPGGEYRFMPDHGKWKDFN